MRNVSKTAVVFLLVASPLNLFTQRKIYTSEELLNLRKSSLSNLSEDYKAYIAEINLCIANEETRQCVIIQRSIKKFIQFSNRENGIFSSEEDQSFLFSFEEDQCLLNLFFIKKYRDDSPVRIITEKGNEFLEILERFFELKRKNLELFYHFVGFCSDSLLRDRYPAPFTSGRRSCNNCNFLKKLQLISGRSRLINDLVLGVGCHLFATNN